jgi:hypothetical protein
MLCSKLLLNLAANKNQCNIVSAERKKTKCEETGTVYSINHQLVLHSKSWLNNGAGTICTFKCEILVPD